MQFSGGHRAGLGQGRRSDYMSMLASHRTRLTASQLFIIAAALLVVIVLLVVPVVVVFTEAFRKGFGASIAAVFDPLTGSAFTLTAIVVVTAVLINTCVGVATGWAVGKFSFRGKSFLVSLIDLPFAVSPVVSGLVFVLLFGRNGWFGSLLEQWDIKVIFALPGIILATLFVTFPFISRELIPVMEEQGKDEEEAALLLGASGWQMFWRVTVPNIRWALLYGVILCAARAVGEFGAVSVVSGHIRGKTNTVPLHIEILYNEYNFVGAFSVSALLVGFAILTLAGKWIIESKGSDN